MPAKKQRTLFRELPSNQDDAFDIEQERRYEDFMERCEERQRIESDYRSSNSGEYDNE